MFCPKCGANLPDNAMFCGSCGNAIAKGAAAGQAPAHAGVQDGAPAGSQAAAGAPLGKHAAKPQPVAGIGTPAGPQAVAGMPAGSGVATAKPIPKAAVAAGLVVLAVIALLAVGFAASWFGLGRKPVYVVKSQTFYDADGKVERSSTYEFDNRGAVLQHDDEFVKASQRNMSYTYEVDDHGYAVKATSETEDGSKTTQKFENEYDGRGDRVLCTVKSDSGKTKVETEYNDQHLPISQSQEGYPDGSVEWKYHANGMLKSVERELEYDDDKTTNYLEYDENGYLISREFTTLYYASGSSSKAKTDKFQYEYVWDFDNSGKPTGYTIEATRTMDGNKTSRTAEYTVDTDDAGNIIAEYDEDGNLRAEFEYQKIDDPWHTVRFENQVHTPYANIEWPS